MENEGFELTDEEQLLVMTAYLLGRARSLFEWMLFQLCCNHVALKQWIKELK